MKSVVFYGQKLISIKIIITQGATCIIVVLKFDGRSTKQSYVRSRELLEVEILIQKDDTCAEVEIMRKVKKFGRFGCLTRKVS